MCDRMVQAAMGIDLMVHVMQKFELVAYLFEYTFVMPGNLLMGRDRFDHFVMSRFHALGHNIDRSVSANRRHNSFRVLVVRVDVLARARRRSA